MAQQMVNGSYYKGSTTVTVRMTNRYAVVNPPLEGKHKKPQNPAAIARRHSHWVWRKAKALSPKEG